jgi:hypothetical protein
MDNCPFFAATTIFPCAVWSKSVDLTIDLTDEWGHD